MGLHLISISSSSKQSQEKLISREIKEQSPSVSLAIPPSYALTTCSAFTVNITLIEWHHVHVEYLNSQESELLKGFRGGFSWEKCKNLIMLGEGEG